MSQDSWRNAFHLMPVTGTLDRVDGFRQRDGSYVVDAHQTLAGSASHPVRFSSHNLIHWSVERNPQPEPTADDPRVPAAMPGELEDHGFDFSSPQEFVDDEGRTLAIALMRTPDTSYVNTRGGLKWEDCLTIPRQVGRAEDGSVTQLPVEELEELHTFEASMDPHAGGLFRNHRADIRLQGITGEKFTVVLDEELYVRHREGVLYLGFRGPNPHTVGGGRTEVGAPIGHVDDLRIVVDESAVELFANGGRYAFATRWFPLTKTMLVRMNVDAAFARGWGMADGVSDTYRG
jgi:beta-fructofuranosidase